MNIMYFWWKAGVFDVQVLYGLIVLFKEGSREKRCEFTFETEFNCMM